MQYTDRIRRHAALAAVAAGCAMSVSAAPYTFEQGGYAAGVLEGSFTAVDLDHDGTIDFDRDRGLLDEVSTFSVRLPQGPAAPSLVFDLGALGRLKCTVLAGTCRFVGAKSLAMSVVLPTPANISTGAGGGIVMFDGFVVDSSPASLLAASEVPEPASAALFGAALLALALRRPARRAPARQ